MNDANIAFNILALLKGLDFELLPSDFLAGRRIVQVQATDTEQLENAVVIDVKASNVAPEPESEHVLEPGPELLQKPSSEREAVLNHETTVGSDSVADKPAFKQHKDSVADPTVSGLQQSAQPVAKLTGGDRAHLMQDICNTIGECTRCKLHAGRKNVVFGDGSLNARLMFIGEGPGADEDEQAIPFVGRAGQVLTRLINRMGFDREEVYIANVVKCRPPGNRDPEEDEISTCIQFLERQIEVVAPDVIMTLGRVSTLAVLKSERRISELRGNFFDYRGIKVMPTYHPSYLLRNPSQKWVVWDDALKVLKVLGIVVLQQGF